MFDQKCLPDTINDILSSREPKFFDDKRSTNFRHAGVLLPLLEEGGVCRVLFTKRTERVEHHKGQISFPGGGVEKRDASIEETVLRETYEEIGLSEKDIEILGGIDDALTMASNYIIHPLVGMVRSMDNLAINRVEVKRVITVPLSLFHDAGSKNRRYSVEYEGVMYETPVYEYREHTIWGATAGIMENFIEIIGDKLCLPQAQK